MSEGPQVKRRTEWLRARLGEAIVRRCRTPREDLAAFAAEADGQRIVQVFCKGKHIFLEFEDGRFLHNHLLMRGRWKQYRDRLLLLPKDVWLALDVGSCTVCNSNGQMLRVETAAGVQAALRKLGPDVMAVPFPAEEIAAAIRAAEGPIGPVLLNQSLVCGLGNIAKSEALFEAGVDPRYPAAMLGPQDLDRLLATMRSVCWTSYHNGGRWRCRVYQKRGRACEVCGEKILRIVQDGRATYYCPRCQGA